VLATMIVCLMFMIAVLMVVMAVVSPIVVMYVACPRHQFESALRERLLHVANESHRRSRGMLTAAHKGTPAMRSQ
jgi:hypothetical protein